MKGRIAQLHNGKQTKKKRGGFLPLEKCENTYCLWFCPAVVLDLVTLKCILSERETS